MATSYPTGLDTFATLVDNTDQILAAHQNDRGDSIEALEIKVGIDSSAVATTIDYFLKNASGAYRTHQHDGTSDDGAKLDWDNCWSDAVHTHASAAEGGQIDLTTGVTGTLPTANGGTAATANANAANGVCILNASGYVATANLGSGSASATTYLKGDQSWGTIDTDEEHDKKARAYRTTSAQTITTSTVTKVQLNAETYDPGNDFDSTSNYRYVVSLAGYYLMIGQTAWAADDTSTGSRAAYIYVNGAVSAYSQVFRSENPQGTGINVSDIRYLFANDYVELYAYHTRGSDLQVTTGESATFLVVQRISS